jgi:hypothetical protein
VRSLFSNRHNSSATLCNPHVIAQSVPFPPLRYSPTLLPGGVAKPFSLPNLVTSSVRLAAPSPRASAIRGSPRESVRNQSCLLRAADRYAYILWKHCLLLSTYLRERTFICTLDLPCCLRLPSFGSLYTAELVRAASSNRNPTRPQRGRPPAPPHHAAWGV